LDWFGNQALISLESGFCAAQVGIIQIKKAVVPTAAKPTTAAAIARILSRTLTVGAMTTGAGSGRGAGAGAGAAGRGAAGAAGMARGAADGAATAAGAAGAGDAAKGAAVGPPGGKVGNFIVGAAEGLGGKLMRTVSFFGWTLPVSFFGGTAPAGTFGRFSAIN
jgi:hypothetical protein